MSTWWRLARRADLGLRDADLPVDPFVVTNRGWYSLHRILASLGARSVDLMAGEGVFVTAHLAHQWGSCLTTGDLGEWQQIGRFDGTAVVPAGIVHISQAGGLLDSCELTPLDKTPTYTWLLAIGQELCATPSGYAISGRPRKENLMSVNLVKGGKADLSKEAGGSLSKLRVGLGWDVRQSSGPAYDLDASVTVLDAAGVCVGKDWFVYYGNLKSPGGAIVHQGDELTGATAGDDEQIVIDLTGLPDGATDLRIAVSIYEASKRGNQSFSLVNNAFVRLIDETTGTELARYDLTEDTEPGTNVLVFGKVYLHNGAWCFKALADGFTGEIEALTQAFKVA